MMIRKLDKFDLEASRESVSIREQNERSGKPRPERSEGGKNLVIVRLPDGRIAVSRPGKRYIH